MLCIPGVLLQTYRWRKASGNRRGFLTSYFFSNRSALDRPFFEFFPKSGHPLTVFWNRQLGFSGKDKPP